MNKDNEDVKKKKMQKLLEKKTTQNPHSEIKIFHSLFAACVSAQFYFSIYYRQLCANTQ